MRSPEDLEREITARKHENALEQANIELRRQVEALRASEERFRLIVDGTRDHAIFMLDPSGHVASWNPRAERIMVTVLRRSSASTFPASIRPTMCMQASRIKSP
jgi:PAS domain-containing protein